MNRDQFWEIIEQSRSQWDSKVADGNMARQCEVLHTQLTALNQKELISFATHFYQVYDDAYRWDLWAAAYIMGGGGCSDDGFLDFRDWLISMGRDVFEAAMKDPESLAKNAALPGVEEVFFQGFSYVAHRVHEEKFGEDLPDLNLVQLKEPLGKRFSEDAEELRKRLPKLFKAFWKA